MSKWTVWVGGSEVNWTVTYVDLDTSTCDNCGEVCEVIL